MSNIEMFTSDPGGYLEVQGTPFFALMFEDDGYMARSGASDFPRAVTADRTLAGLAKIHGFASADELKRRLGIGGWDLEEGPDSVPLNLLEPSEQVQQIQPNQGEQ